jgi:hypothetical protein
MQPPNSYPKSTQIKGTGKSGTKKYSQPKTQQVDQFSLGLGGIDTIDRKIKIISPTKLAIKETWGSKRGNIILVFFSSLLLLYFFSLLITTSNLPTLLPIIIAFTISLIIGINNLHTGSKRQEIFDKKLGCYNIYDKGELTFSIPLNAIDSIQVLSKKVKYPIKFGHHEYIGYELNGVLKNKKRDRFLILQNRNIAKLKKDATLLCNFLKVPLIETIKHS